MLLPQIGPGPGRKMARFNQTLHWNTFAHFIHRLEHDSSPIQSLFTRISVQIFRQPLKRTAFSLFTYSAFACDRDRELCCCCWLGCLLLHSFLLLFCWGRGGDSSHRRRRTHRGPYGTAADRSTPQNSQSAEREEHTLNLCVERKLYCSALLLVASLLLFLLFLLLGGLRAFRFRVHSHQHRRSEKSKHFFVCLTELSTQK